MTRSPGTSPDLAAVRAEYPILERLAYLQTGTFGVMAEGVLREVLDLICLFERRSFEVHDEIQEKVALARARVSASIGAQANEIALTRNATDGVNFVAASLPWGPDDEIIISDREHPAMNFPWRWVAQRTGATLRLYHIDHDPAVSLANVAALITPRTRLIGTSWVTSGQGTRVPAREICALAREHGALSLIDGAQAFGVFGVDVRDIGCDYFTSNGHKWLGGPKGTGFFWARQDRIADLMPAQVGAGSTERFSIEEGLTLQPSNRRFEFGTDSHPLHAGLTPALDWFDQLGWDWIEARIASLSTYLKEGLSRIPGVTLLTPMAFEHSSGLTSFELEGADEKALMRHLTDEWRVYPRAVGPHRIRVSTAFYNTEEEIDRLISGVRSFAL